MMLAVHVSTWHGGDPGVQCTPPVTQWQRSTVPANEELLQQADCMYKSDALSLACRC